jgi:hypothetical protein
LPYFVRFRPGAESCQRSPGAARRHCPRATGAILFASRNEISIHLFLTGATREEQGGSVRLMTFTARAWSAT